MAERVQFLEVNENRENGFPARELAYVATEGRPPAIVWLGGFRSDMTSTKAVALAAAASDEGRAALRFDYTAHGASSGDFDTATLSLWLDDALHMLREKAGPRPVIVGSSMGGWVALLATLILTREGRAPGALMLIAPAVDFTERLMWAQFPEGVRRKVMEEGVWYHPSEYSPEPYPITRTLIEDGRKHLLMGRPLAFGVPIHILQGAQDPDVPIGHVRAFVASLAEDDVRMTVIPDGDHRLSRPEDIAVLTRITLQLAREVEKA